MQPLILFSESDSSPFRGLVENDHAQEQSCLPQDSFDQVHLLHTIPVVPLRDQTLVASETVGIVAARLDSGRKAVAETVQGLEKIPDED